MSILSILKEALEKEDTRVLVGFKNDDFTNEDDESNTGDDEIRFLVGWFINDDFTDDDDEFTTGDFTMVDWSKISKKFIWKNKLNY